MGHNLYRFDFFFVVKDIQLCVWRTKQLNLGGTNLTNVQYADIGNQVKFIDTIKSYQQSLSSLVENASEIEKTNVRASRLKFIEKNETCSAIFNSLPDNDKNWILGYLCGVGKSIRKNLKPIRTSNQFQKMIFFKDLILQFVKE